MRGFSSIIGVVSVIGLSVACSPSGPTATGGPTKARGPGAGDSSVSEEWRRCETNAQCETVGIRCCACTDGDYTAVTKEHVSAAHDILDEDCGDCPAMDCPPIDASCVDGLCAAHERGYAPKSAGG